MALSSPANFKENSLSAAFFSWSLLQSANIRKIACRKYFSHVKDVFLQCKGTIFFSEKNPCDLSKAESSPLRKKHIQTLTTTEENPMPPPKDRGILARGWFPVLSRLPRILLHIVSKTFESFEHGLKVHE